MDSLNALNIEIEKYKLYEYEEEDYRTRCPSFKRPPLSNDILYKNNILPKPSTTKISKLIKLTRTSSFFTSLEKIINKYLYII